jgi:hypothetical protein
MKRGVDRRVMCADETPHEREAVSPDTMTEILWKVACK